MPPRAVIYAVAASPLDKAVIWAGTDDGLVHVTRDGGKTWKDVTPPGLASWDKVSQIDAGHFDGSTAYVSINALRKNDLKPHIYRTHDYGVTWKEVVAGMNPSGPVNVVREDVKKPGLLYAGSEREVYFSIDDGDRWQSLRMNMPATSIRDLVVHENDLVIGTHGRSIWILDDVTPLRNLAVATKSEQPYLFEPVLATRMRSNMFHDTPLPPEEPAGENPPDGAILDYWLPKPVAEVMIEILDAQGKMVHSYSSKDQPEKLDSTGLPHPTYWIRPVQRIQISRGHHRAVWNLRYRQPAGADRGYSIAAVHRNTPSGPSGPFVHPGTYTVRLTADGSRSEQKIRVRMDPNVVIRDADLKVQTDLSTNCYTRYHEIQSIRNEVDAMLADPKRKWKKGQRELVQKFRGSGDPGEGDVLYGSMHEAAPDAESLVSLQHKYLFMLTLLQSADARPVSTVIDGVSRLDSRLGEMKTKWASIR